MSAIPMPLAEHEIARALEIAREMARAGIPIFVAAPAPGTKVGYALPPSWETTTANPAAVDQWRPGWALCAVGGHVCDFLDTDPRNGGHDSFAELRQAGTWPRSYGVALTPSGGTHNVIAPLGVGKGELVAGIDLQGGRADGSGRGFVFIAPTVRASKVDGVARAYRWDVEPQLAELAVQRPWDTSGAGLAKLLPVKRSKINSLETAKPGSFDALLAEPEWPHTVAQADHTIHEHCRAVTEHARAGWSGFRDTINRAAYSLGAYVGSGYLPPEIAVDLLVSAVASAGHEINDDDERWIEQGITDGSAKPIRVVAQSSPLAKTPMVGEHSTMLVDGDTFLSEVSDDEPAMWGDKDVCLWAPGESLMIVGPPGVGKSTLAHLLTFAAVELIKDVLSYPTCVTGRNVLYLAMDRPKQIARAMRRLRTEDARVALKKRLVVHKGPLPVNLVTDPEWILRQAQDSDAGVVVIDSIKDLLPDLSDENTASLYNRARQLCLAQGIEWIELHHNRKASAGNEEPKTLDDVYGSRWLTAGAGSVLSLWGQPGDAVVRLTQIKAPSGELFPKTVAIDKHTGLMSIYQATSLESALTAAGRAGLTAREAAVAMFEVRKPSKSNIESTRQKLNKLCSDGYAFRSDGPEAFPMPGAEQTETRYYAMSTARP